MPEWLNVLVRSAALVLVTLLLIRLLGRRVIARLTFFDLIAAIALGVIVAAVSLNLVSLAGGLLALAVWALFPAALHLLSLKYKTVRDFTQGRETVLINQGRVQEDQLMAARYTPEDLLSQLRARNVFNFADVEFAVLEPTGDLSVLLKKEQQPLTPKTAGLQVGQEAVPQTVILDGEILDDSLTAQGLNRSWLRWELEKTGVAPENVFIAQVDDAGQLYLDLFDDKLQVPQPKTRDLIFTTLKKCQADCELFALGTRQPEAKGMYTQCSTILSEVIQDLKPLLKR